MKKVSLIFSAVVITAMTLSSCGGGSKDVTIGEQVWMAENLNVDKFRNGDPIPEAKTAEEWERAGENGEPAWCYYDNDLANGEKYGKLYNGYAVSDPRGLAPKGYHVPTDAEWTVLSDYLGGENVAGGKMKSTGTQYWVNPNRDATNESGFSGLPGGGRDSDGTFGVIGNDGSWWSSTVSSANGAWYRYLYHLHGDVRRIRGINKFGFSVRCLRD